MLDILREYIEKESTISATNLETDHFLKHLVKNDLIQAIGNEFYDIFKDEKIDKVITIEVSGIIPALATAMRLGVSLITAKKSIKPIDFDIRQTDVYSFSKQESYKVYIEDYALKAGERVLIIDDYLARGHAVLGLQDLIEQAEAVLVGVGIVIEKGFETGGEMIRKMGIPVHALAIVDDLSGGEILLREN